MIVTVKFRHDEAVTRVIRGEMGVSRMSGMMLVMAIMMARVSANSPPRFLLDTNVGSEIVLRLTEGETENKSILRWDKFSFE